jgi:hypothetical protein
MNATIGAYAMARKRGRRLFSGGDDDDDDDDGGGDDADVVKGASKRQRKS